MISKEEKVLYHDNGNLININGVNYIKQSAKEEIRAERDREILENLSYVDNDNRDIVGGQRLRWGTLIEDPHKAM